MHPYRTSPPFRPRRRRRPLAAGRAAPPAIRPALRRRLSGACPALRRRLSGAPGPRRRRTLAAAAAAAAVTLLVPGAGPARAARAPRPVFVVGDSLTVGATALGGLKAKLQAGGYQPTISAQSGRGVQGGLSALRSAGALPTTIVVALGTNDVASGRSQKSFTALVDQVMATVGANRFVLWINLDMEGATWAAAQSARYNQILLDKDRQYANLVVADWQAHSATEWLQPDAVHLTGTGYRRRADFYLYQLQTFS